MPESVEYSVSCVGDEESAVPDEVTLDGNLDPASSRAHKTGMLDVSQSETWTGFIELPPGSCLMQLRGRDDDGEVICTVELPFSVVANAATQVVVPLECSPTDFTLGREFNICPDLLAFRCGELDPMTEDTSCLLSFRDEDRTCSRGCDPQTCIASGTVGLTCTPGPDPGVSTTISCSDAVLDCTGDGIPDSSCTVNSNTPGARLEVDYTIVADFFVACVPPASGGMPGATITCTAVTSDGDFDCDRTRLITVDCPNLAP